MGAARGGPVSGPAPPGAGPGGVQSWRPRARAVTLRPVTLLTVSATTSRSSRGATPTRLAKAASGPRMSAIF